MQINSNEHHFMSLPFTVLTLCGTWYPDNSVAWKKRIYDIYKISIILLGLILLVQVIVNVILTAGTQQFNMENIFALIVFSVGMFKKIILIYDRNNILRLIHYCAHKDEWHQPQNSVELAVKKRIQDETRQVSLLYAALITMALLLRAVQPVIEAATFIVLPLEAWYPYAVDNVFVFFLTYVHQVLCGVILTCMHLATDTLFVGLMLQVRYQLNILALRFEQLKCTKSLQLDDHKIALQHIIAHNVQVHKKIYRFGNDLQEIFKKMSMGQVVVVIPNIILNLYFLCVYTDRLSLKYFTTLFFFVVPLMQCGMFCWYGNEIILACSDVSSALYECDWVSFNKSTRKLLLPIFMRSTQPIVISAGAVIPYNVDSFIKIMKSSYSAFNLLQQTIHE